MGWTVRGTPLINFKKPKSLNYTFIGAATANNLLGFKIFRRSMKSEDFLIFILELLQDFNYKNEH